MRINDMTNLYIGCNEDEHFYVLICALDINEAIRIAEKYRLDSNMLGAFEVQEYVGICNDFDCDYVLM